MWNILSCKRHTELASHKLDRPLSLGEKFQYYIHRIICIMCRRFEQQLSIIQRSAKTLLEEPDKNECLSTDARDRIKATLSSSK